MVGFQCGRFEECVGDAIRAFSGALFHFDRLIVELEDAKVCIFRLMLYDST